MTRGLYHILMFLTLIAACVLVAGCGGDAGPGAPPPMTTATGADLTNQYSPEAATFPGYPSQTNLHTPAVPVGLRFVAGGFAAPMMVASPRDGTGRLFLVDQTGTVKIFFMNGTVLDRPFLDLRDRLANLSQAYDERGLLSIAFHPGYATNGRVFAYYSAPLRAGADPTWSCTNRLSEFHVSVADPNLVDTSPEKILLEVDKPAQNHNGGTLLFGPGDGYLYLPLGDGGRADDTGVGHTPGPGNAQDMTKLLGKVIRIDVDTKSPGLQYGIPADNPFVTTPAARPEIFAYGFRNPAYATFDSGGSHRMFIAMAGQRLFESVLIVYRGGAYPWNIREGTHCFDPANDAQPKSGTCPTSSASGLPLIGPVVELGHDVGNTVVGGVLYRGSLEPSLQGQYVFGTWSDAFTGSGNGTLLVAAPPPGIDLSALPAYATALTPGQNAMWTTRELRVADNTNGRINAFVRGLSENNEREILILVSRTSGPSTAQPGTGEIWAMVPAGTAVPPSAPETAAPSAATTAPATPAADRPTVPLTLTAHNLAFDQATLTAPAGSNVVLTLVNQDAGVPHNFALYTDATAATKLFAGNLLTGPGTVTYTFTAPATPGNYFFRCDVHPGMMTGTFVVT